MTTRVVSPAIVSRASVVPFSPKRKRRSSREGVERAAVSAIGFSLGVGEPGRGDNERAAGQKSSPTSCSLVALGGEREDDLPHEPLQPTPQRHTTTLTPRARGRSWTTRRG